jgi:electron transport complex protein RnfG
MKDILQIIFRLTLSCLVAAFFMGAVFTVTHRAKEHNERRNVRETMLGLLGYGRGNPAPPGLEFYTIYRYIVEDAERKVLGYLVPVKGGATEPYAFFIIDLNGNFVERFDVGLSAEQAADASSRMAALEERIQAPKTVGYADSTIIADLGGRRLAYLLPGTFPGFKTFIRAMLALDPSFRIIGLEIMEDEEDPGLGGEIEEAYFKNQFRNKSFQKVKELKVVKEPLPEEYRRYLEDLGKSEQTLSKKEILEIRNKYQDADIYALTGATISSRAVTAGVKNIVKKFAYRLKILDGVIAAQKVETAF